MKTIIVVASMLAVPLLLMGCASIVDSGPKSVQIDSNPEGAMVTISNREGKLVYTHTTPVMVKLKRSSGYFEGEDYTLTFDMAGYYPYEMHVDSSLDGWYFGNFIFGGIVIGMLTVDPLTGDMFTLSPRKVNCVLVSTQAPLTSGQPAVAQTETNSASPNVNSAPTNH